MQPTHDPQAWHAGGSCCSNRVKDALLVPLAHGPAVRAHAVSLALSAVVITHVVSKVKSCKVQRCSEIMNRCRDLCDKEKETIVAVRQRKDHATKILMRQHGRALGPASFHHEIHGCQVLLERGPVDIFCQDIGRVKGAWDFRQNKFSSPNLVLNPQIRHR